MAFKVVLATLLSISTMAMFSSTFGQMTTSPCTSSMITSFTPCVNYVTNANTTLNTTAPPFACCSALASLTGTSKDCFCQIVTGNVPFQIPINQTLAISLPRACNMPGVPLQCKALGAPAPAPGPLVNGPDVAPSPNTIAPAGAGQQTPTLAPEPETTATTPPSPATSGGSPDVNTGSRTGVTPSVAYPSFSVSPPLLLVAAFGAIAFNYY